MGLTVIELGAGYGRWLVAAHHAARSLSVDPVRLIGVEMVGRHFDWMHEHLNVHPRAEVSAGPGTGERG